jgi:hypothetical protein
MGRNVWDRQSPARPLSKPAALPNQPIAFLRGGCWDAYGGAAVARRGWSHWVVLTVGLAAVSPGTAHAESDRDRAAARSAADAGGDAYDQGQYERAIELFHRAEQLVHAPPHLLFMARSLMKLGRLVEARETYLKILHEQLPANAPNAFKSAHDQAEAEIGSVEKRIAYVTVTIHGRNASRAALTIDRADVPAAEQGIPLPLDPGSHVFSAHTDQTRSDEKVLQLGDGANKAVELILPEVAVNTATGPSDPTISDRVPSSGIPPEPVDRRSSLSARRVVAYTALGVGAVGLGVGTYFAASSLNSRHKANQVFECNATPPCDGDQKRTVSRYDHDANVSGNWAIVSYAIGAAAIGTSVVLLVTDPGSTPRPTTALIQELRVSAGIRSVAVLGRF